MRQHVGFFVLLSTTAVFVASSFAGCGGGISPGDYKVYRVAVTATKNSSGCFTGGAIPADNKSDTSSFRETRTVVLYAGLEDAFYLDTGDATLEGTEADGVYDFVGKTVDVDFTGPNGTLDKLTQTTQTTVEMIVDGAAVNGQATTKTSLKCSGATCGVAVPSCTETLTFVGSEVEDVELDYTVVETTSGPRGGTGVPPDPSGGSGDSSASGGVGGASTSTSVSSSSGSLPGTCAGSSCNGASADGTCLCMPNCGEYCCSDYALYCP